MNCIFLFFFFIFLLSICTSSNTEVLIENLILMSILSEIASTRTTLVDIEVLTTLVVLLQTNLNNPKIALPALKTIANLCHAPENICTSLQHHASAADRFQDMWKVEVTETIPVVIDSDDEIEINSEEEEEQDAAEKDENEVVTEKFKTSSKTILVCATCAHSCWKYSNPRYVDILF